MIVTKVCLKVKSHIVLQEKTLKFYNEEIEEFKLRNVIVKPLVSKIGKTVEQ